MDDQLSKLLPKLLRTETDARPVVVMMCGISGAGKSTLSKAIVSQLPSFERLSIDASIGAKHGLYGVDYPPHKYAEYQHEASGACEARLISLLRKGEGNIVVDRSFYSKEDRDYYKHLVETHGARWVLVHLRAASKDVLRRIVRRKQNVFNADSAYDMTEEVLGRFWDGFEAPIGEGEIVIGVR